MNQRKKNKLQAERAAAAAAAAETLASADNTTINAESKAKPVVGMFRHYNPQSSRTSNIAVLV